MLRKHVAGAVLLCFVLAFGVASLARADHWVYLGSAHVDGNVDHDNIHVGRSDGRFKAIQLRVDGGAVDFDRIVVHFDDGTQEDLAVRDRVRSGGKTHKLDLPGEHRVIDSVELWYGKEKWDRRPKVSLYGAR